MLFFTAALLAQKPVLDIKFSEQLAVLVFVQNLSSNYPDNPFKTEFSKSPYNIRKYQNYINGLDTLAIDYTYQFSGFPYGSKLPGMTKELLNKNLIATDNLTDFKLRSIGLVPNSTLDQLVTIISEFTPIYRELIYNPNKDQFEKQLTDIIAYSNSKGIADYFDVGLHFYNSTWDYSIPFEIAFYPLPNSEGFTAHAFYNNFISAVQTDLTDYKVIFSVMLHEIYHIIYDEQSLSVKTSLYNYFKHHPSKNGMYAYLLLNEVLATSIGNGFVFEKLEGKTDTQDWYNWKYINLMAKQAYPLVKQYIVDRKPIDESFVNSYIKLYDQNFPDWINEMDNLMNYRYTLSQKRADFNTIKQLYPHRSMSEDEDEITPGSIEKMKAVPMTKIIIVSKNNTATLEMIKGKFPELKNWKYQNQKEFEYHILLNDKTWLFIINQKSTSTETIIKKLRINKV